MSRQSPTILQLSSMPMVIFASTLSTIQTKRQCSSRPITRESLSRLTPSTWKTTLLSPPLVLSNRPSTFRPPALQWSLMGPFLQCSTARLYRLPLFPPEITIHPLDLLISPRFPPRTPSQKTRVSTSDQWISATSASNPLEQALIALTVPWASNSHILAMAT